MLSAGCGFLPFAESASICGSFLLDFPLMRTSHEYQHNPWPDVNYRALLEGAGVYPAVRRGAQEPHAAAVGADRHRQRVDRRNLFFHHFGSRTFAGNGINAEKLLDENVRRFAEKWGLSGINGRWVAIRLWHGAADARAELENSQLPLLNGESRPRQNGVEPRVSFSSPRSRLQVRPSSSFDGAPVSDPGERAKVSLTMIVRDEDAELWFRKAVVHRHRGESAEAETDWRRILGLHRPDQFCSFDQGIYGHLTRRNLAALSVERGDHAEARQLWADVLGECPGDRERWRSWSGSRCACSGWRGRD